MDSSGSKFSDCNGSHLEFKWNEVLSALATLSLKYVALGDYIVVLNGQIDATIAGEPYLALQLWLNMKSGKVISRIWDETIAFEKVADVSQFTQACIAHFQGRPCIGYPVKDDENSFQSFVISQTPIPRKISRTCQKVLDTDISIKIKSCKECLRLRDPVLQEESAAEDPFVFEQILFADEENGLSQGEPSPSEESCSPSNGNKRIYLPCDKRRKYEGQYACDTLDCGYRTKKKWNLQVHCKQLCHYSSCLPGQTSPQILQQGKIRWRKNEGKYACESADCSYKTDNDSTLQDHCQRKSH